MATERLIKPGDTIGPPPDVTVGDYDQANPPRGAETSVPGVWFYETLEELEAIPEDKVNKPSHYAKWPIQPITFIMRNGFEFWRGNIVKYASRAGSKKYDGMDDTDSEITDLKKVIRYAEMRINQLQGASEL